jgi:hypothetical protein
MRKRLPSKSWIFPCGSASLKMYEMSELGGEGGTLRGDVHSQKQTIQKMRSIFPRQCGRHRAGCNLSLTDRPSNQYNLLCCRISHLRALLPTF